MHYFTLDFLEQAAEHVRTEGVYHIAKKKIPSKDGPVQVLLSTRLYRCSLEPFQDCHYDIHGVYAAVLDDSIRMQTEITLMLTSSQVMHVYAPGRYPEEGNLHFLRCTIGTPERFP